MFNNAGNKIVLWSKIVFFVGVALSLVFGFLIIWRGAQVDTVRISVSRNSYLYNTGILSGNRAIIIGFLVMIFGSLASWLTALLLKAFGDLSADTQAIRKRLEWTPFPPMRHEPPMGPRHEHPEGPPVPPIRPEEPVETRPEPPVQEQPCQPAGDIEEAPEASQEQ